MILAIVQARMSSCRLPGKVMKKIMGKPMIGYLLDRLSLAKHVDKIVLATSVLPENDELARYVRTKGIDVYRGNENDVLDRFYRAAKQYTPYGVMRITGDCPLLDPNLCDLLIETFEKEKLDYIHTGPTFAEGLDCEVLTFLALEKIWEEASLKSEREHVTLFVHNHPQLFKKRTLVNASDDSRYRFSVDEEADFEVVARFLESIGKKLKKDYTVFDVKSFFDLNPQIARLNEHIKRNKGLKRSLLNDVDLRK